jgi:ubiquinone/menaquinone biosynthesis C-methylase UbiE
MAHSRERAFLRTLERENMPPLRDCEILDVGCGSGGLLLELLRDGAEPGRLHGVDLLDDRVTQAAACLPNHDIRCADAQELPFDDGTFDLVLQYTVLTSILDRTVQERIAREMLRVVRKPHGLIISYDFWLNPFNRDTRGLRPSEIRRLFPGCRCSFTSLTLAPPIVRQLVRISWLSCDLLEAARLLNTHYLAAIRPPATEVT